MMPSLMNKAFEPSVSFPNKITHMTAVYHTQSIHSVSEIKSSRFCVLLWCRMEEYCLFFKAIFRLLYCLQVFESEFLQNLIKDFVISCFIL